jgi:uncharacterized protein (DUF58 family)
VSRKQPEHSKPQNERQLNTWLLPALVAVLAVLYIWTGFRGWLVFLIGTGGAWLLAVLWVHALERGLSIERKLHLAWVMVGDSLHEQFTLINSSWLPAIWVEIVDASASPETPIQLVSDVESHASRRRYATHLARRRGLYELGPTRLRTGDPFGIYTLTLYDQHRDTVLVTPPRLPLTQLRIIPGGWAGDQQPRRWALERNISNAGVRDYLSGDSLRRIHWRASAHHDRLMVRQLEAAASEDWWIFVDLEASVQAGNGQDSTLELSIVLAASLVERGFIERRRVGLASAGAELVWLEPHTGPAHRWRILRALSMAKTGNRSLADLLRLGRPTRTATLIVITPSSDPTWVAACGQRRRGDNVMALLVDPTEFGRSIGQERVVSALAQSGIPSTRMSRTLLEEAYPHLSQGRGKRPGKTEGRKRYLQRGRTTWQNMG